MKLINLLEWDISYQKLMFWCQDNKVPVRRISITKFSIPDKDYLMFKLAFDKQGRTFPKECEE